MAGQILRCLRQQFAGEIARGGDNGHTDVRADAHRNHVFGDLLAGPYTCIKVLGDNISQTVIDDDLDIDLRVLLQ